MNDLELILLRATRFADSGDTLGAINSLLEAVQVLAAKQKRDMDRINPMVFRTLPSERSEAAGFWR